MLMPTDYAFPYRGKCRHGLHTYTINQMRPVREPQTRRSNETGLQYPYINGIEIGNGWGRGRHRGDSPGVHLLPATWPTLTDFNDLVTLAKVRELTEVRPWY